MNSPPSCVVLGGGGHARVVIDCLRQSGAAAPVGILDPGVRVGVDVDGVPVLGGDDLLASMPERGITHVSVGVGGTADNRPRAALFERAEAAGLTPVAAVHPRATVAPDVTIGAGSIVFAGAVLGPGVRLGRDVIVNTGAVVDHDCELGDHVHVSPGAVLCGGVRVGRLAHVGAGAVVRQLLTIGEGAVVGLGAAVVRDVLPEVTVLGVPAAVPS